MAEQLHLQATSREERYQELYPQLQSLTYRETNLIANLANAAAASGVGCLRQSEQQEQYRCQ